MHNKFSKPRDCGQSIIAGTDSYRLSSRKLLSSKMDTPFNNFGGNRQNLEKDMRIIWEADPGYAFVQVDQAGAEALIVAHLCRSAKYRQLFQNNIKPHTYLALKLFWKEWVKEGFSEKDIFTALATPIAELKVLSFWKALEKMIKSSDNWSANRRYYHMSKKTVHAGSYGMKGNTFRLQLLKESGGTMVLSADQADAFLEAFHKEFPEIREWHSRVYATVKATEELRNLFDYPFKVTDFVDENDFKDLISWVPQSTVACITRQAYIKMQLFIETERRDWHLMADTHDSLMLMVPVAEVKEAATIAKQFIEIELQSPYDNTLFRMKSEAQSGLNWSPYKPEKNPEGLQEVMGQ